MVDQRFGLVGGFISWMLVAVYGTQEAGLDGPATSQRLCCSGHRTSATYLWSNVHLLEVCMSSMDSVELECHCPEVVLARSS